MLDGAHNPSGARALAESLPAVVGERPVVAVVSILEDKDAAGMLAGLLPRVRLGDLHAFVAGGRAAAGGAGEPLEAGGRPAAEVVPDPAAAVDAARTRAGEDGAVLVTGSIYLLAELAGAEAAPRHIRPTPGPIR